LSLPELALTVIYEIASNNLVAGSLAVAGIFILCGYQAYCHEGRGEGLMDLVRIDFVGARCESSLLGKVDCLRNGLYFPCRQFLINRLVRRGSID
jgi:hypothetical protein